MLNLRGSDVKQIFKNDLLTDTLMNIFKIYLDQDEAFFSDKHLYLVEILGQLQSVASFDLACDMLMDDEIQVIKDLCQKVDSANRSETTTEWLKVKAKFSKLTQ